MHAAVSNLEKEHERNMREQAKRKRLASTCFAERVFATESEVLDGIMTSRCPHCATPFADFSGCAALQCGSCQKYFCGLCGSPTPDDGHAHVLDCQSRCFFKMNGVFLRLEEWLKGKSLKNNIHMDAHLVTLPDNLHGVKRKLWKTFHQEEGEDSDSDFSISPLYEMSPASLSDDDEELSPALAPPVDLPLRVREDEEVLDTDEE